MKDFPVHFLLSHQLLPYSPSRDTYTLDDADTNLSHEHKEKQHEVEGAVIPKQKEANKHLNLHSPKAMFHTVFLKVASYFCICY